MLDAIRTFVSRRIVSPAEPPGGAAAAGPSGVQLAACALLLELAHVDGTMSPSEQAHIERAVQQHFGLDDATARELIALAEAQRRQSIDHYQFTRLIAAEFDLGQKMVLAELMWGVFPALGHRADPTLPIIRMRSMNDVVDAAIARPKFLTVLLGIFAGLALALAAVGTYGILAYLVSERKREIGIRMALGAARGEVLRLILRRGVLLTSIGLVLGLGASFGLTRVIRSMLFNVTPTDPWTLATVAGVIAVVSLIACIVPAWRATRVDPLVVLRDT